MRGRRRKKRRPEESRTLGRKNRKASDNGCKIDGEALLLIAITIVKAKQ
jgi:hypothetical protein